MIKKLCFILILATSCSSYAQAKYDKSVKLLRLMGLAIERPKFTSKTNIERQKSILKQVEEQEKAYYKGFSDSIDQKTLDYLLQVFQSGVGTDFKKALDTGKSKIRPLR